MEWTSDTAYQPVMENLALRLPRMTTRRPMVVVAIDR